MAFACGYIADMRLLTSATLHACLNCCQLAGSRDADMGNNGRRSQGAKCTTLPSMDPTRSVSLVSSAGGCRVYSTPRLRPCYIYRTFPICPCELWNEEQVATCLERLFWSGEYTAYWNARLEWPGSDRHVSPMAASIFTRKCPHRQGSLAHGSCFAIGEPRPLLLITIASADISHLQEKTQEVDRSG
jgi:hypothetical protein